MTSLIITLPPGNADDAALLDYVLSPDGRTLTGHATVPLAMLPALPDRQTEVVAVVPASLLSWHQVQLPQGSLPRSLAAERASTRLRAILDGLLEDQLLDDPALLHLAVQPQPGSSAPVWVAACDRAWLKAVLAALAQSGHAVTRIVPEFTPQALSDAIYVTGDADSAQLACLLGPTTSADSAERASVLVCGLSAASVALLGEAPAVAARQVLAEPAVAALAEQSFKRAVTLQQRAQRLLLAAQTPWDLAQFELAHARRDRRWATLTQGLRSFAQAPQWRAARWALTALLLGNLAGLNAWALHEQASLKAQRQKIQAVLTETFPKIPVVVDAPVQMAREVAALQRATGALVGSDLESMLAAFAAVAPAGYVPTAIDYTGTELRLTGPAGGAQAQILEGLAAQGLSASSQADQWLIRSGSKP